MTKDSVKTALEANGAVKVIYADPKINAGAEVHRIFYRVPISTDVDSDPKHFDLVKQDDGTYKYQGAKPAILRDAPTAQRDFHYTDIQIKNGLEAQHAGWKVLQINQRRDGDLDQVTVKASDGTNVITKNYTVWEDNGTVEYKEAI